MLQTIRDHLTGWIAGFIFGLIILTFVFWGIDFGGAASTFAAKVNGEEIPVQDYQQAFRNQLALYQQFAQTQITPQQEAQIRERVLDSLVRAEVLDQHARALGYRIGDATLGTSIRELPAFQVDGRFDPDAYKRLVALQGRTPTGFEEEFRRSLMIYQLQDALRQSSFVTPAELARQAALENERREVAYLRVRANTFADQVEVSEEQIVERYEQDTTRYVTPETVTLQYLEITGDMLAGEMQVEESDLREAYETERAAGNFTTPEERHARHVLITIKNGDEAAARTAAEAVARRARDGEDFAALAAEVSDDTTTAQDGGDLGWVQPEMMVGAFSDALFAMQPDEVSEPIRTEFGFHVIRLDGVRGGETRSYEDARAELEEQIRRQRAESVFFDRAERLADLAFESLDSLQPAAQELKLEIRTQPGVTRLAGEGIAANPAVREAAFSRGVLEEGENSDIIEIDPEHAVVVRVSERQPASRKPLEQVRDQIVAELRLEATRERAREQAEGLVERVRSGAELAALAEESGAQYHVAQFVGRTGAGVPRELVTAVFAAARPSSDAPVVASVGLAGGDFAVYRLTQTQPGQLAESTDARREQLAEQRGAAELAAYLDALTADARVVVPPQATEPTP